MLNVCTVVFISYDAFMCFECDLRFVASDSVMESGAPMRSRLSWEEMVIAPINTWLVRIELMISVDREHVTRTDQIMSAPTTHPVTQAGHTAMSVVIEKE
jgi:hypothetical protein